MATYYFRNTGDVNWGTASNWSLTDGGGATGAVPTSADDAYFTSNSGNCTVNTSSRVCKTLIFSGVGAGNYAGTFTMSQQLTVSGSVTLSATMTVAGTSTLVINATATLTSNGKTWTGGFQYLTPSTTLTFGDNWTFNGAVDVGGSTNMFIAGNKTITCTGSFNTRQLNTAGSLVSWLLTGTGTWSAIAGSYTGNITINTAGTITCSGNIYISNANFTYTAGTVVTTGSTFNILGTCTVNSAGITWNNIITGNPVQVQPASITLTSNLTVSGNFTTSSGNHFCSISGALYSVFVGGNLTHSSSTQNLSGTATLVMNGTGAISTAGGSTNGITINTNITSASVTLSGTVNYGGSGTLTLSNNLGGSGTLTLFSSCTIVGNGYSIPNLTFLNNSSITLTVSTSDFTVTGNMIFSTITNTATVTGASRTINIQGNLTMSALTTGIVTGTANLKMTGTGNLSMNASVTTGYLANNLEIASSNVTIVNTIRYQTGTFKLSGSLLGTGVLSILSSINLDGGGFTIPNLYASTAGITITLLSGIVISSSFQSMSATSASRVLFTSNSGGVHRKLTLNYSGTQYIMYTNATYIDSGDGQTIRSFGSPTLTNTINWNELKAPVTRGFIRG